MQINALQIADLKILKAKTIVHPTPKKGLFAVRKHPSLQNLMIHNP